MKPSYLLLTLLLLIGRHAFCQSPPQEFFTGLGLVRTNEKEAKTDFLIAISKAPQFHGSYHFLGVIYLDENNPDSAIWCFKTSIALNTGNVNHTREMAYMRLISTYVYQHDFANAFNAAWTACKLYPDNQSITSALKDACLWSFYIKYDGLDPSYLSPDLKTEYVVTSIPQEYLIFRWLEPNKNSLGFISQSLTKRKGAYYDIFHCTQSASKDTVEADFKINWDMNKDYGGKVPFAMAGRVSNDTTAPVYQRAGAMLIADDKTDIKAAIEKLTPQ